MSTQATINALGADNIRQWLEGFWAAGGYGSEVMQKLQLVSCELEGFEVVQEDGEDVLKSGRGAKSTVIFKLLVDESMCSPTGFIHGGCTAYLLDVCTSLAIRPFSKPGFWFTTGMSTSLITTFLNAVPCNTTVLLVNRTLSQGKAVASYDFEMISEDGKTIYAKGTHTKADTNKVNTAVSKL
ncbi:hypothetical protein BT69DRAFT_1265982 [Atractiella rhizophila]|nr:hypothetical protein BT69DRAFT_1265982 [Atractiella rhizophila]